MFQQRDQGKSKYTWNKWKWGHNNPKSVGHWESNSKREIHSITGLSKKKPQEAQINNLTLHLKEHEKENKAQKE